MSGQTVTGWMHEEEAFRHATEEDAQTRTFLNGMAPGVPVHDITLAQDSPAVDFDRLLPVLLPCTLDHVSYMVQAA